MLFVVVWFVECLRLFGFSLCCVCFGVSCLPLLCYCACLLLFVCCLVVCLLVCLLLVVVLCVVIVMLVVVMAVVPCEFVVPSCFVFFVVLSLAWLCCVLVFGCCRLLLFVDVFVVMYCLLSLCSLFFVFV